MKRHIISMVIFAVLLSACSSTVAQEAEPIVVHEEVQASAEGDGIVSEASSRAQNTSVDSETLDVGQTSEEVKDVAPPRETPSVDQPAPTFTSYPTLQGNAHPEPKTPLSTATPVVTVAPTPTSEPTPTLTPATDDLATARTAEAEVAVAPAQTQPETITTATAGTTAAAGPAELVRIPDTDPAPPLAVLVSTIQIEENGNYKLTGTVRNDGTETYGGVGVIATFYEAEKPCVEREVTPRTKPGEPPAEPTTVDVCQYNWHGPVQVYVACQLLEPGAECPFSLEIYGRDYVSYLLHPEGSPVEYRQPASLLLSSVSVYNNGLGYVRITGKVTNQNPSTVRDANIAGTLIDSSGQIASVGSVLVPGEIASGASVDFDLRVAYEPYASYQLDAQATQQ